MRTIKVTHRQVESARLAVKIAGGLDKVDPLIAKIATAERPSRNGEDEAKSP
ncbi:MAG TPA: hypothetical protein VE442_08405 [Jatrophihabitans sp.]|jgi:hypothetical protein|nr:hypothetical protein [Jatrophihabitans sp.]